MRIIFYFSILLGLNTFGQSFRVIQVSGDVKNVSTGKPLKIGDEIKLTDKIEVTSDQARCFIQKTDRTRLGLNSKKGSGSVNDLFAEVPERRAISTRGDKDSAYISMSDYFGNEEFVLVDSLQEFLIDKNYFKGDRSSIFILSVKNGDNTIKKKLNVDDNKITIDVDKFEDIIIPDKYLEASIIQVFLDNNEFTELQKFRISFLPESELINVVSSFKKNFCGNSENCKEEVFFLLSDIYGKIDFSLVEEILERNEIQL